MESGVYMGKQTFEYDVAISFLQEDESLAVRLNDQLTEQMKTFLYTEQQKKLGGTDGEETLNKVFGSEARIVVILYRKKWGETPWTRIEKTAIRNRAYEKGYGFTIFILTEKKAKLPEWVPKTQIWLNLDRYGIAGAASIIEERVKEGGGECKEETPVEHAKRIEHEIEQKEKLNSFLHSVEGVNAARIEAGKLIDAIEKMCGEITAASNEFPFKIDGDKRNLRVAFITLGFSLSIGWWPEYANTLDESYLLITLLRKVDTRVIRPEYEDVFTGAYELSCNISGEPGWIPRGSKKGFLLSYQLADECIKKTLEQIRMYRLKKP